MTLTLGACASTPSGVLIPATVSKPEAATDVSVLVYSTRALSDEPGEIYSGQRGDRLSSVVVDITIPPSHQTGVIEWPRNREVDPAIEFATRAVTPVPDDAAAEAWMVLTSVDGPYTARVNLV